MSKKDSQTRRLFRRLQILALKGTLAVMTPLDGLLQFLALGTLPPESSEAEVDNKCLAVGRFIMESYQKQKRSLEMKRLRVKRELFLERERICQIAREHRQLLWQIQVLKYKEDASIANRQMLLDLLQEIAILRREHVHLNAKLRLMEYELQSMELNKTISFGGDHFGKLEQVDDRIKAQTHQSSFDSVSLWSVRCVSLDSEWMMTS